MPNRGDGDLKLLNRWEFPRVVLPGYHKRFGSKGNKDIKRPSGIQLVDELHFWLLLFFLTWLLVENNGR